MIALNMNCAGGVLSTFPDHTRDREKARLPEQIKETVKVTVKQE